MEKKILTIEETKEMARLLGEEDLIEIVRLHLAKLRPDKRKEFISECMDKYCNHCGSQYLPCYCINDD